MGLTLSSHSDLMRMGAWQVRVRGPLRLTRSLQAVLSPIAITEEELPPLDVLISEDGLALGTVDGQEAWRCTRPRRGWLTLLLGYVVATATSLLRELHFVHAGAVEMGGRGYVLVGPPGAGKTSLVGLLLRRGAAYLSDEVALLDAKAGTLHPFTLPLAVKPWTAKAIGPLPPGRLVASDADIRYLLPARRTQRPVPIDSIMLLDPTAPAADLVEIPRGEMLLALSEQPSSFRHRQRLEAAFSGFVQVVRRARCVRLGSAVPATAAGVLGSLLGERP